MDQYLIVAGRFNEMVSRSLVEGALQTFEENKIGKDQLNTIWVPGAFEIPVIAAKAARSKKYRAIICLGAVIRGDTAHFEYVAGPCASALMNIGVETEVPVVFGVLTVDTVEQALNRAGLKLGNKGSEAVHTALATVHALDKV